MAVVGALQGHIQEPANGKPPTAALVLLHGYGSNGADLIGLAPFFAQALPHVVFYSPNAPLPLEGGVLDGYQWFPLQNFDPIQLRHDLDLRAKFFEQISGEIARSAGLINTYLDEILAAHKLAPDRLALLGFSQGCMLSLYVALRRTPRIAGVAGYSGELLFPERLATEMKSKPPVALIHGEEDPVIPAFRTQDAEKVLKAAGVSCRSLLVPGLQHGIDGSGAQFGADFLREVIG
jgi:phospholipase/carboxylesterase